MKKNKYKLIIFSSIIIFMFGLFLYFIFKPYNYKQEYAINSFKITEEYKDNSIYVFKIKDNNSTYAYTIKEKYFRKRELITNIDIIKYEDETCIIPKSNELIFYPLCSNENELYTYNLAINDSNLYKFKIANIINENFRNINIKSLNNESLLLFNYKGFYLINKNNKKEINLFEKDIYRMDLIYQKEKYLLIPDYNQDYYFNKIFIINILNGKVKEIELEHDVSYESEFLGDYKNNVYLLDRKEKKEYRINLKKNTIEKIDFQILKNDKMIKTAYKNVESFKNTEDFKYQIIDNLLYQIIDDIKIKISNLKVDKIIKNIDNTVYFLSSGNLYSFNNEYGEVLLITNFEWNFNNANMIYLYK